MGLIDTVSNLWSWIPWVMGFGTIGWIALALLAPGVLSIITPWLKLAVEMATDAIRYVWQSFMALLDTPKAWASVLVLLVLTLNYASVKEYVRGKDTVKSKSYVERVVPTKKSVQTKKEEALFRNPLEWLR